MMRTEDFKTPSSPEVQNQLSRRPSSTATILVVDDDPDYLALLVSELEQIESARISQAIDVGGAIEILLNQPFDLVVCDWALAQRSAPEIFLKVDALMILDPRRENKIPIMFMSGSEKVGHAQRLNNFVNFEAVSFILKRLGPPLIGIMAGNILERSKATSRSQPCVYLS